MQDVIKTVQDFIATDEGRWACIGVVSLLVFLLILATARTQHQCMPNALHQ